MTTGRINQVTIVLATGHARETPTGGLLPTLTPQLDPPRREGRSFSYDRPRRRREHASARANAQPGTAPPPAREWPSNSVIQLPPLSSPRDGPPQNSLGPRKDDCETVTWAPREEDTAGRSRRQGRLPTAAYPRKSDKNLSQRPVIHRPQHHRVARASRISVTFTP